MSDFASIAQRITQLVSKLVDEARAYEATDERAVMPAFEAEKEAIVKGLLSGKKLIVSKKPKAFAPLDKVKGVDAFANAKQILTDVGVSASEYLSRSKGFFVATPQSTWVDNGSQIPVLDFETPDTLRIDIPSGQIDPLIQEGRGAPGSIEMATQGLADRGIVWSYADPHFVDLDATGKWFVSLDLKAMASDMVTFCAVIARTRAIVPGWWTIATTALQTPQAVFPLLRSGQDMVHVHQEVLSEVKKWIRSIPGWEADPLLLRPMTAAEVLGAPAQETT